MENVEIDFKMERFAVMTEHLKHQVDCSTYKKASKQEGDPMRRIQSYLPFVRSYSTVDHVIS